MIVECPYCKAAHSKPEREAVAGVKMSCRRCFKEFTIGAPVPRDGGTDPTVPAGGRSADAVSNPSLATTEVMKLPPGASRGAKARLEAVTSKAETKPGESLLVPAPTSSPSSAATAAGSVGEIREMLDRIKQGQEASVVEEPVVDEAVSASPMASEASLPGTGLFFDEEPPATRTSPQQTTEPARPVPGDGRTWPTFPIAPLRRWGEAVVAFVRVQPLSFRIALLAGGGLVLVVLVIGVIALALPDAAATQFIDDNQVLMAGPGSEESFPKVGELLRGEEVLVLDAGRFGAYALVRDYLGRAGYVAADAITEYRPLSRAGVPFVGCRIATIEADGEPCRLRAQAQFDSCREVCSEETDEEQCLEQCQRQLTTCIDSCDGKVAPAPASAEPALEPPPPEPIVAPVVEPDKTAVKKPSKPVKKPKKPRRK